MHDQRFEQHRALDRREREKGIAVGCFERVMDLVAGSRGERGGRAGAVRVAIQILSSSHRRRRDLEASAA